MFEYETKTRTYNAYLYILLILLNIFGVNIPPFKTYKVLRWKGLGIGFGIYDYGVMCVRSTNECYTF